jgi:hypothetical protein
MDSGQTIKKLLPPQNNEEEYGKISITQLGSERLILAFEQPHALDCAVTGVSFTNFTFTSTFSYYKKK